MFTNKTKRTTFTDNMKSSDNTVDEDSPITQLEVNPLFNNHVVLTDIHKISKQR